MSYYKLVDDVYRIQAGVGKDGDIYGGIFIDDEPGLIIGCSGESKFVKEISELLKELKFSKAIRVYLPAVTYHEIMTAYSLQKKFPEITFHVHEGIADAFENPEKTYLSKRFFVTEDDIDDMKKLQKKLPKNIENVFRITKSSSLDTLKTKILIIPFGGPHKGHTFIYSRNHKLLCSGIVLGRTSDSKTFYLDKTGSITQYENALSFLEKAKAEILVPSYDEPEFVKNFDYKVNQVRDSISLERKNLLEICSLQAKTPLTIYKKYREYYADPFYTEPYNKIDILLTRIQMQLEWLVDTEKLIKIDGKYRIKN